MNFAPLDTTPIEQRLREQVPELEAVHGAVEYADIKTISGFRPGTAYVVLANESNPAGTGGQPQRLAASVATFGVVVVTRNYRGAEAALDEIKQRIGQCRAALHGWEPDNCDTINWLQGNVLDSDQERVVWLDIFTTTHILGGKP